MVLEVLVEPLLRERHGVDVVDRADRGGIDAGLSEGVGHRRELAGRLAGGGRRRDQRSERRLAVEAPVLEVHHQIAERPHVGHVEPEVQRAALDEPVVDLLDVVGERGVVETGQVDRRRRRGSRR